MSNAPKPAEIYDLYQRIDTNRNVMVRYGKLTRPPKDYSRRTNGYLPIFGTIDLTCPTPSAKLRSIYQLLSFEKQCIQLSDRYGISYPAAEKLHTIRRAIQDTGIQASVANRIIDSLDKSILDKDIVIEIGTRGSVILSCEENKQISNQNGPATQLFSTLDGKILRSTFLQHGEVHNLAGKAIACYDNTRVSHHYAIDGKWISEEEWISNPRVEHLRRLVRSSEQGEGVDL